MYGQCGGTQKPLRLLTVRKVMSEEKILFFPFPGGAEGRPISVWEVSENWKNKSNVNICPPGRENYGVSFQLFLCYHLSGLF